MVLGRIHENIVPNPPLVPIFEYFAVSRQTLLQSDADCVFILVSRCGAVWCESGSIRARAEFDGKISRRAASDITIPVTVNEQTRSISFCDKDWNTLLKCSQCHFTARFAYTNIQKGK